MQASSWLVIVVFASFCTAMPAAAQAPVGALAIDERQGDQWGWAVDYETAAAAQARALDECGPECSVVLTFGRCAAYAADQDADSTAVGWAEAYALKRAARPPRILRGEPFGLAAPDAYIHKNCFPMRSEACRGCTTGIVGP